MIVGPSCSKNGHPHARHGWRTGIRRRGEDVTTALLRSGPPPLSAPVADEPQLAAMLGNAASSAAGPRLRFRSSSSQLAICVIGGLLFALLLSPGRHGPAVYSMIRGKRVSNSDVPIVLHRSSVSLFACFFR